MSQLALGYLFVTGLVVGLWALFLPTEFYTSFPGFGHRWVSVDGPSNEHLIRDVGAAYLSFAALAGLSLVRPDRASPFAVGFATLFFNVPHLAYHATHLGMYTPVDQAWRDELRGIGLADMLAQLNETLPGDTRERAAVWLGAQVRTA